MVSHRQVQGRLQSRSWPNSGPVPADWPVTYQFLCYHWFIINGKSLEFSIWSTFSDFITNLHNHIYECVRACVRPMRINYSVDMCNFKCPRPCLFRTRSLPLHYGDVMMGTMASQITNLTIVYSTVYSGADQRKHQSSASLAFVRGIHRGPVNSPHKWPVTQKMFPFDDVIMTMPVNCTSHTSKSLSNGPVHKVVSPM